MRGFQIAAFIIISFVLSCKPSEKNNQNPFEINQAHWSTWVGGQPGIGGNRYDIRITSSQAEQVIVKSLVVDGEEIPLSGVDQSNGIIFISAIENKSNNERFESSPRNENRPSFRKSNPDNAELTIAIKQKTYILPLSFVKK